MELPGIIWKIIPFLELHDFFSCVLPLGFLKTFQRNGGFCLELFCGAFIKIYKESGGCGAHL
jgi:hypothetical protein